VCCMKPYRNHETGPDRIEAAPERPNQVTRTGIAVELPVVIADDAEHKALHALKPTAHSQ
jgi:hypothetical protein